MNKIVITGAPCTGKTEFLQWLHSNNLYDKILYFPEIAAILKEMNFAFNSVDERQSFQCKVYNLQRLLEDWSECNCGKHEFLICDRGTLDAFAYCDLADVIDLNIQNEYKRYKAVLHFRCSPCKEDYEKLKSGNLLRDESYERVLELDTRLFDLWGKHKFYFEIPWEMEKNNKYLNAFAILSEILQNGVSHRV